MYLKILSWEKVFLSSLLTFGAKYINAFIQTYVDKILDLHVNKKSVCTLRLIWGLKFK